jgi:hypothetical protein
MSITSDSSSNLLNSANYRYYRIECLKMRGPNPTIPKISYLFLYNNNNILGSPVIENFTKDNNYFIVDSSLPKVITHYTIQLSTDNPQNDIISWVFYGSNDKTNWITLDTQNNMNLPIDRNLILPKMGVGYSLLFNGTLSNLNIISTNSLIGSNSALFVNKDLNNKNICSDFITIDTFKLDTNLFTIALWLTKDNIDTPNLEYNKYILDFKNINNTVNISIFINQNIIYLKLDLPGGTSIYPVYDSISYINSWFHLVWTFDGKDWYIYINNKQTILTKVSSFLNNEIFCNNIIGCSLDKNPNTCFSGKIDDFKFYNYYFNSDDVDMIYGVASRFIKLVSDSSNNFIIPQFYKQINNSILTTSNTNGHGITSVNSFSGSIMLTINPPPLNCIIGFSENNFEELGVMYGFKTIDENGFVVIPIAPDYTNQPRIRSTSGGNIKENDPTMNLKLIINGLNIKYMINDIVICIRTRINKLPLYVVGALLSKGQFFSKIDISNNIKINIENFNDLESNPLQKHYNALNNDPSLLYYLKFLPEDYIEEEPLRESDFNTNIPVKKIRIDGSNNNLQLAQVSVFDINNNMIIYDTIKDKINASEPLNNNTHKNKPIDGTNNPRSHPDIYHSGVNVINPFWELEYDIPKKIKRIVIHTRSDGFTERIASFALKLFFNNNTNSSIQLANQLTNTFLCINNNIVYSTRTTYIKNYSLSNLKIKACGPIYPTKEDDNNVLRLSNIMNKDNSKDQHLELSPFPLSTAGLTFSFWFKGTNSSQSSRIFDFATGQGNGPNNNIFISIDNDNAYLNFGNVNLYNGRLLFKNYNFEWIHVAWVLNYNLNIYYIYLNGICIHTILNARFPLMLIRNNLFIGKSNYIYDSNLNGFIADFRIYNRELTGSDINIIYSFSPLKNKLDSYSNLDKNEIIIYKYNLFTNRDNIFNNINSKSIVTLVINQNNITNLNILNTLNITISGAINIKQYNGLDYFNLNSINYSDSVIIPPLNLSSNGLTFSFWIKPLTFITNTRIFDFGNGNNKYNIVCYIVNKTQLVCSIFGETNTFSLLVTVGDLTSWTHIVWTISINSIWSVYKNGSLLSSIFGSYPTVIIRNSNYIGKSNNQIDSYINYVGYIDDFRLYYRELRPNEINTLFLKENLSELNKDNSLVLYYNFENINNNRLINLGKNEGTDSYYFNNDAEPTKNKYFIINQGSQTTNISLHSQDYNYNSMLINKNSKFVGINPLNFQKEKSNFINFNSFTTENNGITICFWLQCNNTDNDSKIMDFGNGLNSDNIMISTLNNTFSCFVYNSNNGSVCSSFHRNPNPAINRSTVVRIDNNLKHFAWVIVPKDKQYSDWYIYINGDLQLPEIMEGNAPRRNFFTQGNLYYPRSILRTKNYLGKSNSDSDFFNGSIEDFRFYNKALTKDEINLIYNLNNTHNLDNDSKLIISKNIITPFQTIKNFPSYNFNSLQKQFILINTINTTKNGISICFWIRNKKTSNLSKIFNFGDNLFCEFYSNYLYFYIRQNRRQNRLISNINLENDIWIHVTWTISLTGINSFYFNGTLKTRIQSVYPLITIFNNNFIGKGLSNNLYFDGYISDFYFIDKEINDVNVRNIYNKNPFTDSVLLFIDGNNNPRYYNIVPTPIDKPTILFNPLQIQPDYLIKNGNTTDNSNNFIKDLHSYNFQFNDFIQIDQFRCDPTGTYYNGYSFSFWFKSKNSNNFSCFFDFGRGPKNENIIAGIYNNYIYLSVFNVTVDSNFFNFYRINNTDIFINDNIWRHFVWLIIPKSNTDKSSATWHVYIDNILIQPDPSITATRTNTIYPNSTPRHLNFIGKSNIENNPFFMGSIDDFRMYNRILRPNEIENLYNFNLNDITLKNNLIVDRSFNFLNTIKSSKFNKYNILRFNHCIYNYLPISSFNLESQKISVSLWFRTISRNTPLFELSNSTQTFNVRINNGFIYIEHYINNQLNNTFYANQNSIVNNHVWFHLVINVNSDNISNTIYDIFINTIKYTFNLNKISISTIYNINNIGKINSFKPNTFTGSMAEFRLLNTNLTIGDINNLYELKPFNNEFQFVYISFNKNKITNNFIQGNSLDATLTNLDNITTIDKVVGNSSLLLNKLITKQFITIDNIPFIDNKLIDESTFGFTIAFWYNFSVLNIDNAILIEFNNNINYFKIYLTQNFIFNIDVSINGNNKIQSINLSDFVNNWFHFALIIKKNVYICYINGQCFTHLNELDYPQIDNNTIITIGKGMTKSNIVTKISNINTGTNGIIPLDNSWEQYSVVWTGYFYTKTSTRGKQNWKFFTESSDASYVWIVEENANYNLNNAIVKNGGIHGINKVSGSISLDPNRYYYIRIIFGERFGPDNMIFSFIPPGETKDINIGTEYFFYGEINDKKSGLIFNIYKGYWEENGRLDFFNNTLPFINYDSINCNIGDFRIFNKVLLYNEINLLYLDKLNLMINSTNNIETTNNDNNLIIRFMFDDNNYFVNTISSNISLKLDANSDINNAIYNDSIIGNYFNIFNNFAYIDSFEIINKPLTITFWYKTITSSINLGNHEIFSFSSNNLIYGVRIEKSTLRLIHRNINYNTNIKYLNNNQWHLITITYNTFGLIKLYIDKKIEFKQDLNFINLGFVNNAYLGKGKAESGIADFRIYNKELTENEIFILYDTKYIIKDFKLVNYYRFEADFRGNYIKNNVNNNDNDNVKYDALVSNPDIINIKAKKEGLHGALFDINKNNYIILPNINLKKSGISINLWYKQLTYTNNSKIFDFINYSTDSINPYDILFNFQLVTLRNHFIVNLNLKGKITQNLSLDSLYYITNNTWYMLTIILESSGICSIYVDKVLQTKTNFNFYPDEQTIYGMIAGSINNDFNNFNYCKIDEFKIYENILTPSEINNNFSIQAIKTIEQYINDLNSDNKLLLFYIFKNQFINKNEYRFKNNTVYDIKVYNIIAGKYDIIIYPNMIGTGYPLYGNEYLTLIGNDEFAISQCPKLPSFTTHNNGICISVMFRSKIITNLNSNYIRIVQFRSTRLDDYICICIKNNKISVVYKKSQREPLIIDNFSNIRVNDNSWHHIVWNMSPAPDNLWTVYLDNKQILNQNDLLYPSNIERDENYIGRSNNNNINEMFNGDIDELRVFNRILDEDEINALYNITTYNIDNLKNLISFSNVGINTYSSQPVYNTITPKDISNVIAWYDPNDIILDDNGQLSRWKNQKSDNLHLNIVNGIILPFIYSSNLQLINFKTNKSFIKSKQTGKIAGFACVINISNVSDNTLDNIFTLGSLNLYFRRGRINNNNNLESNDVINGSGGVISINGSDVYNNTSFLSRYNNTDRYIILYVKFSQFTNFTYDTDIIYQISSDLENKGFVGYIGDFITFNKFHTYYDQKIIEGYLAWKYGLQKDLPQTHLYFSNPPTSLTIPRPNNILIDPTQTSNVIAWFDPNNINLDSSNNVLSWNNKISSQLNLTAFGNITTINYNSYLKLISINNNKSCFTTNNKLELMNGFMCVVYLNTTIFDYETLFGSSSIFSDRISNVGQYILNRKDKLLATNGLIAINGTTYCENYKLTNEYININNYIIIYAKYGLGGISNYDIYNSVNLIISNFAFGMVGYIGDFICFKPTHTKNDQQRIEGYLAWKYDLQRNLPDTHPYKISGLFCRNNILPIALPVNDGLTYNRPIISSDIAKSSSSRNFWIKTNVMIEPDEIFVDMENDGGGWALVYETTSVKRNRNNFIPYTVNKSNSIGLTKPSRIAYRIENNGKYIWVSFDAWSMISSYDVPTGDSSNNIFIIQRDVNNMNIISSNSLDIRNVKGVRGRLQIFASGYGPNFDTRRYNHNNCCYSSIFGPGCFQVFNIENSKEPQTIFGWNNHDLNSNINELGFGFGNNKDGNIEWTDAKTQVTNFKFQIFIKTNPITFNIPQNNLILWFSGSDNITKDLNDNISSWGTKVLNSNIKATAGNNIKPKWINNYIDFRQNQNSILITEKISTSLENNVTFYFSFNGYGLNKTSTMISSIVNKNQSGYIKIYIKDRNLYISLNKINPIEDWNTLQNIGLNQDYILGINIKNNGNASYRLINAGGLSVNEYTFKNISNIALKFDQFEIGNTSEDIINTPTNVNTCEFKGKIGEILIYNRILTDNDIKIVEDYMTYKYIPSFPGQRIIT